MKHFATLFYLTIVTQSVLGQINSKYEIPGFVQINDTLFISKYEISIRDYAAYLLFLRKKQNDSLLAEKSLPNPNTTDWTIWNSYKKELITFDIPIIEFNSKSVSFTSAMGYLPIVNVSKRQALDYCNFKALDYDLYYNTAKRKAKKKLPSHMFFRLLTETEWKEASGSTLDTSIVVCIQFFQQNLPKELRPLPIFEGEKNSKGLFNMIGNVAEIVSDAENAI
jgi:formylglycine-generating enzyme required for sulfatase activity